MGKYLAQPSRLFTFFEVTWYYCTISEKLYTRRREGLLKQLNETFVSSSLFFQKTWPLNWHESYPLSLSLSLPPPPSPPLPGSNYFFGKNFIATWWMKGYTLPKHQNCKKRPVLQIRVSSNVSYGSIHFIVQKVAPTSAPCCKKRRLLSAQARTIPTLFGFALFSQTKQFWAAEIDNPNFEEGSSFKRSSISHVKYVNVKNARWRQKTPFQIA